MYIKLWKRVLDFSAALLGTLLLSPVLLILILLGAIIMRGNPFFVQVRPGKDEKLFKMVKFRSMTCAKDTHGNLLPDDQRLTAYGRFLRSSSLDELPELWNILKGDMSIVGPRPQLVRDMVFMTPDQRRRHSVPQGLTGLAQINGRNNMTWEQKIDYDLHYIENITFREDFRILMKTVVKVFARDGIATEGMDTAQDLGDYLLDTGRVSKAEYDEKQAEADALCGV
jgi:lipopolysaccharide/colanic/teichoic acid biosynthesis glycosyltransferase